MKLKIQIKNRKSEFGQQLAVTLFFNVFEQTFGYRFFIQKIVFASDRNS